MLRLTVLALLVLVAPVAAGAVGSERDAPPEPTETTTDCDDGEVWDSDRGGCVAPEEAGLDDDVLYRAARELAYAGSAAGTLRVLDAMADQTDDRVLAYRGFAHRLAGDMAGAMAWYRAALAADPDNLLARSYMGMALVEQGEVAAARAQLSQIRARGGRGTWPEIALRLALGSGRGFAY
jgi:tetratricopeptide (TPR) repeat protein